MLSTGKRGAPDRFSGKQPSSHSAGQSGTHSDQHPGGREPSRSAAERYEVLGRAGEGTLFAVYRVRERATGRILALKALKNAFVKHPRLTHTLARAIEPLLPLNNSYLARVSDVGLADGTLYFVQEWLQGRTLEDRLRQAPLPHTDTLLYVRQLAEALHFLHAAGLTHGDLRPRQVWLTSGTQLKITDVCLGAGLHEAGIVSFDIQQETAYYLAPERFDGAPTSGAADYYALGVILYHMLAGRVPFDGPSPLVIAARHRNDVPLLPSQFNPSCSPALEELAMALLEKQPQTRYRTAQELLRNMGGADSEVYQSPYVALTPQEEVGQPVQPIQPVARVAPVMEPEPQVIEEFSPAVPLEEEIVEEEELAPSRRRRRDRDVPIAEQALDLKLARKRHRKREFVGALLALFWFLISVGLLFGMGWFAYTSWMQEIPADVRVPKYTGLKRSQAEATLGKAGLRLRVGGEKYNPKIPEDTILSGDPPAGKIVRQGREVIVVLSKGEEPVRMYDFSELSLVRARQIIARDGMRLGLVSEQFHDRIPTGYVCGQYPPPGTPFRRSEPINITVSKGAPPTGDIEAVEPLPPPPVPNILPEDNEVAPDDNGEVAQPMVSRSVQVRVALPKTGGAQEVKIVVNDVDGEDVVYRETHNPSDLIDETVRVRRPQGSTARIRIYIDGKLYKENRI